MQAQETSKLSSCQKHCRQHFTRRIFTINDMSEYFSARDLHRLDVFPRLKCLHVFPRFIKQCQREKHASVSSTGKRQRVLSVKKRGTRSGKTARKKINFCLGHESMQTVPNMGIILTQWCQGSRTFQPVEMAGKHSIGVKH